MIDILLATYNSEKYLKEQLDSLLAQTDDDFTLIASDDASCDNTINILEEYKTKFNNIKIYANEKGSGSAKNNFFKLLTLSTSPYVMFCDHDDYWEKEKIEKTLNVMITVPQKSHNQLFFLWI